jgi:hypothetical protein
LKHKRHADQQIQRHHPSPESNAMLELVRRPRRPTLSEGVSGGIFVRALLAYRAAKGRFEILWSRSEFGWEFQILLGWFGADDVSDRRAI